MQTKKQQKQQKNTQKIHIFTSPSKNTKTKQKQYILTQINYNKKAQIARPDSNIELTPTGKNHSVPATREPVNNTVQSPMHEDTDWCPVPHPY